MTKRKSTKRKTMAEFKDEVREKFGSKYIISGEYINNKTNIHVFNTKCGHDYNQTPNNLLRGAGCKWCAHNQHIHGMKYFSDRLKELCGDSYIPLTEKIGSVDDPIILYHVDCGHTLKTTYYRFLEKGQRCFKCFHIRYSVTHSRTPEQFQILVNKITNGEYSVGLDYGGSYKPVRFFHNVCHKEFDMSPYKFLSGHRCTKCHSSRGEDNIINILDMYEIKYKYPKSFKKLKSIKGKPLRYDFYVPSQKILIEYQGRHHYQPITFGDYSYDVAKINFKIQQEHDKLKREYAREHGYKLIEIPYTVDGEDSIKKFLIKSGLTLK